jgi:hypothetical protein
MTGHAATSFWPLLFSWLDVLAGVALSGLVIDGQATTSAAS